MVDRHLHVSIYVDQSWSILIIWCMRIIGCKLTYGGVDQPAYLQGQVAHVFFISHHACWGYFSLSCHLCSLSLFHFLCNGNTGLHLNSFWIYRVVIWYIERGILALFPIYHFLPGGGPSGCTQGTLYTTTTVDGVLVHQEGAICTTQAQYKEHTSVWVTSRLSPYVCPSVRPSVSHLTWPYSKLDLTQSMTEK